MLTSVEQRVRGIFNREALQAARWSNEAGFVYPSHRHPYTKVLYCVEGSIAFRLDETEKVIPLNPGDRLDVPAETTHSAVVGSEGVVCLEAHR